MNEDHQYSHYLCRLSLYRLGHVSEAALCLQWAVRDGCQEKSIPIWQAKLSKDSGNQDVSLVVEDFHEIPRQDNAGKVVAITGGHLANYDPAARGNFSATVSSFRTDWYQSTDHVIINIYARNVQKACCQVDIQASAVSPGWTMIYVPADQ